MEKIIKYRMTLDNEKIFKLLRFFTINEKKQIIGYDLMKSLIFINEIFLFKKYGKQSKGVKVNTSFNWKNYNTDVSCFCSCTRRIYTNKK